MDTAIGLSKKVKPPPIDYDTRKERRKRANHGKIVNLNTLNKAIVFKNHLIRDEDPLIDAAFRR